MFTEDDHVLLLGMPSLLLAKSRRRIRVQYRRVRSIFGNRLTSTNGGGSGSGVTVVVLYSN